MTAWAAEFRRMMRYQQGQTKRPLHSVSAKLVKTSIRTFPGDAEASIGNPTCECMGAGVKPGSGALGELGGRRTGSQRVDEMPVALQPEKRIAEALERQFPT